MVHWTQIGRKKPVTAAQRKRMIRRRGLKPSKGLKAAVKKIIAQKAETKYVAENITPGPVVVPAAQTTPANLARMLPRLTQGIQDNQRIGDVVQPIHARTYWTFYLNRALIDLFDVTLNVCVVYVKGATTDVAVAALPGGDFLKVGDGTNTDPAAAFTPVQMLTYVNHYPVNNDQYTLKKWFKRRICKGAGDVNGLSAGGNSPPTGGQGALTLSYKWKPPTLKYSDGAQNLPRNHYPVYLVWATANDGSALNGLLSFNCRTEMHYKDE